MSMRKILVDDTKRELCAHGIESFPLTVNHDDLWDFEGKTVPIHWHNDLEISLPRKGEAIYQIYEKSYYLKPGEGLLINQNVPHSCHSSGNQPASYSTILVRPDFMYGDFGSDVEKNWFRPFLQNSAIPCVVLSPDTPAHRQILVLHPTSNRTFSTACFVICCVVVSRRCHRIASFLRLVDGKTFGTESTITGWMEH